MHFPYSSVKWCYNQLAFLRHRFEVAYSRWAREIERRILAYRVSFRLFFLSQLKVHVIINKCDFIVTHQPILY